MVKSGGPEKSQPTALALAAFMLIAGIGHLVFPHAYRQIVPPQVGDPAFWVRWSGVAEITCVGLLWHRRTRRAGALLTVGVLVAVFPANVKMALDGGISGEPFPLGSTVVAWTRLPLQVPLVLWAWWVAKAARVEMGRPADRTGEAGTIRSG